GPSGCRCRRRNSKLLPRRGISSSRSATGCGRCPASARLRPPPTFPLEWGFNFGIDVVDGGEKAHVYIMARAVSPGYCETMGIPATESVSNLYFHLKTTGSSFTSRRYISMRVLSSAFDVTRIPRSKVLAIFPKKDSIRFSHEP